MAQRLSFEERARVEAMASAGGQRVEWFTLASVRDKRHRTHSRRGGLCARPGTVTWGFWPPVPPFTRDSWAYRE